MAHIPEDFKRKKYQKMGRNAVFSSARARQRQSIMRVNTSGSRNWGTQWAPPSGLMGNAFGGSRLKPILRGGSFNPGIVVIRKSNVLYKWSASDHIKYVKNVELSKHK